MASRGLPGCLAHRTSLRAGWVPPPLAFPGPRGPRFSLGPHRHCSRLGKHLFNCRTWPRSLGAELDEDVGDRCPPALRTTLPSKAVALVPQPPSPS